MRPCSVATERKDDDSVSTGTSFREIVSPLSPEEFFGTTWDQRPLHIPGPDEKFAGLFSWEEFNRILNMSKLWSDRTMKVVLDGNNVDLAAYGRTAQTREGYPVVAPDAGEVLTLLGMGATVILDLIESLSPGVAAVAASLQNATGGVAVCNAYCSWRAHQGFVAHFDTTDVFAVHIAGSKRWRVYEGRVDNPVDEEGPPGEGSSRSEHAKGELLEEVEMTPGDVLYLPRGQYHEALASSEACLHLSFGIGQPTGIDVISRLLRSLPDESLFRRSLPHFDRPQAHREHLRAIADRLHAILSEPGLSDQIREWQRGRALEERYGQFRLPSREPVVQYRVRSLGLRLDAASGVPVFRFPGGELPLEPHQGEAAAWILSRDYVDEVELARRFPDLGADGLTGLLERLETASILDRI